VVARRLAQVVRFNDGLLDLLTRQVVDGAALAIGDRCKNGICLAHSAEEHFGVLLLILIVGHCVHGVRLRAVWLDWTNAVFNICIVVIPRLTRI
jgi:hypothetical protein